MLTSVDQEGTGTGFDLDLVGAVSGELDIPVIASGGAGNLQHVESVIKSAGADAVAMAHILHYDLFSINEVRMHCQGSGIPVRHIEITEGSSSHE